MELLLKDGAPVNCRVTEDASTPLHKACAGSKPGHLAAVKLLLMSNADVHALNKWRETPLLTAANHGQAGAVDALLKAGADPCKCTDTGWSPLSIAAYKGHDDVVKLLLEEGAPTEEADPTLSALLQAATKGLPDTVELLLKHGADHTVTTKKGDTALSILVEQNLIDAAVDMVAEYNASIPRCSRDRKKVQRARLLINLRMKQREREGKGIRLVDNDAEDDETDHEENPAETTNAESPPQLDDEDKVEQTEGASPTGASKKKKKKKKSSAEQQAKEAEEALLMELELEDAERQKQEQEANKKSAKKRKKKERERQQKKEQEEQRLAEEREREEKLRKEREKKEAKERAERERLLAIKRKEEEEERKRILEKQKLEQQQREEQRKKEMQKRKQQQESTSSSSSVSSTEKKGKQDAPKPSKGPSGATSASARPGAGTRSVHTTRQAPAKPSAPSTSTGQPAANSTASKPPGKNRGWETKAAMPTTSHPPESKQTPPKPIGGGVSGPAHSSNFLTPQREAQPSELFPAPSAPSPFSSFGGETMTLPGPAPVTYTQSEPIMNGFSSSSFSMRGIEVPAVALFRRNKVSELLQRCSMARSSSDALGAIDEATIKKVLYRWMVRAAHEGMSYLDCVIPSWTDFEKQAAFFQRQFISESRKGMNSPNFGSSMVSMEVLREAGSTISLLCYNLAKEVAEFRGQVEEQLPSDWNDAIIGMKASDVARNGSGRSASIVLDWANRAQVFLPALMLRKLQERYTGYPGRLLSAIFSTHIRYETQQLITANTMMDFRLPSDTLSALSMKANISAEIWSDPMSSLSGNVFWGQFPDVDEKFGGLAPFSKDDGSEDMLVRHGGSVVTTIPLDNMVASRYLQRMLDLLDLAENGRVPLSFAVFLRSECFLDGHTSPSFNDLCVLEPRFRERGDLVVRVEELVARQHGFSTHNSEAFETSATGSLLVILQNNSGTVQYRISDLDVSEILRSLSTSPGLQPKTVSDESMLPVMSEMSFSAPEFVPAASRSKDILVGGDRGNNFFHHHAQAHVQSHAPAPHSPMPHQNNILPDFGAQIGSDFGGFGGGTIGNAFSVQGAPGSRSSRPARGRLFDLVDDDGGDDDHGTADVVSGMLGNLNMDDLFSNQPNKSSNGEIDIEAISLMGIGPNSASSNSSSGGLQPRRSHFGY